MSERKTAKHAQTSRHERKRSPTIMEHALGATAVIATAVLAIVGGQKLIKGFEHQRVRDQAAQLAEQSRNDSGYPMPGEDEPHWRLVFGHTYKGPSGRNYTLTGVNVAARYVHTMSPHISYAEARDYITAGNVQFQESLQQKVSPFRVQEGQALDLPFQFGPMGELANPETDSGESA